MWVDSWLINIYKGQICDVVTHIKITFVVIFVVS